MELIRWCTIAIICYVAPTTVVGQEKGKPLPKIWDDISREYQAARDQHGDSFHRGHLWPAAKKIAKQYDRSAIEALFSISDTIRRADVKVDLAAYTIAEIADPDDKYGMKHTLERWEPITIGLAHVAIAGIDCYHDDSSREWLLTIALDDKLLPKLERRRRGPYGIPSVPHFALQFLRGYEPTDKLRDKIEKKLLEEEAVIKTHMPPNWDLKFYTRADDIRAVLSSMDYVATLKDLADQSRYRNFERRLWRARTIGPRGFRGIHEEFMKVAGVMAKQWRDGDEQFVLRIFENRASTPDELSIAVYLISQLHNMKKPLPDEEKLQAIAKSKSRQAPYASKALKLIADDQKNR